MVTVKGECPGCKRQVTFIDLVIDEGTCPECKARIKFLDMYLVSFGDERVRYVPPEGQEVVIEITSWH